MPDLTISDLKELIRSEMQVGNNNGEKKLTHQELADIIPTNFSECPGGDCGHQTLRSNKFTNKRWECPECRANANPEHTNTCLTCGRNIPKDERNDSEVELE